MAVTASVGAVSLCAATPAIAQGYQQRLPHPEQLLPDDQPPLPEDFMMTRPLSRDASPGPRHAPDPSPINLPRDVPERLSACWSPPPVPENQVWQVTLRLSFTAEGAVIGIPATPYLAAPSDDLKRALRASLLDAVRTCTPLRFTASLGRAIAGRIFAIRFFVHHVAHDQRT